MKWPSAATRASVVDLKLLKAFAMVSLSKDPIAARQAGRPDLLLPHLRETFL